MPFSKGSIKIGTVYNGDIKIGQIYKGSQLVYQSAFKITYVVDSNVTYTEKVNPKASILNPTTFTPKKDGYTFAGWRKDKTAEETVLTSEVATQHTTLYAVFKKAVVCTFKSYGKTEKVTGYIYYNNGNSVDASVTVPTGATYSGWTWRGWANAGVTTSDADVAYKNGAKITGLTSNKTYGGLYSQKYEVVTSWKCDHCGKVVSGTSKPSSCPNNVCGSKTAGQSWTPKDKTTKTRYYNASA